jgi:hypothetical protein
VSPSLPPFNKAGLLPPGDYPLTIPELLASHLVTGAGVDSPTWDRDWRRVLVGNLEILASQLWQAGISKIFIDGSFVEAKDHPNDIDGYFECRFVDIATGRLPQTLNFIDPYKIWTWDLNSRRPDPNSTKTQLPMWHQYRIELYPHYVDWPATCGIRDVFGNEQTFPAAFRKTRGDHKPKGIIRLVP